MKIPNPLGDAIRDGGKLALKILRTEFKTDAGRINAFFGFLLFIILIALLVPDYVTTTINFILIVNNKPKIPTISETFIILFVFIVTGEFIWCVWYLGRKER
jgi:hypothetical protein